MDCSIAGLLGKETEPKSGFNLITCSPWSFGSPFWAPEEIRLAVLEPPGHSQLIADEQGIILKKKNHEDGISRFAS